MTILAVVGTVLIAGISGLAVASESNPLRDFVKHSEFRSVTLSPDGNHVAVAAPSGDQTGMVVIDISNPERLEAIAGFELRSEEHVGAVYWANNERIVFTTNLETMDLNQPYPTGRIYGVDRDGQGLRLLYGRREGRLSTRRGSVMSLLRDQPDRILIQTRDIRRDYPRAKLLDVNDGRNRAVANSPLDGGSLLADQSGEVRFAQWVNEEQDIQYQYRDNMDDDWSSFETEFPANRVSLLGFDGSGDRVYLSTDESERMGLYELDLDSGEVGFLVGNENVEVASILRDRQAESVVGAVFHDGRPEMRFIDPDEETSRLQRMIAQSFPGQYARIVSFARDADRAIVRVDADIAPPAWFLFDLEDMSASYLLGARDWVEPENMFPTEPIEFEARDGKSIPGYLTTPGQEGLGEDWPMIVYVHGGPHGVRDYWGYDPVVQLLVSRGYAVLQVNFRGSGGYGIDFQVAGYREWGAAMQDDVTDATRWAIERGYADPDRICIHGGSYGGYATLMGLVREPDLYACGAANVGVYDLPLMKEEGNISERLHYGPAYLDQVLGTDEEVLKERSPARRVDEIEVPIYIAHGEEDEQAHIGQFHFLKEQLDEAEVPYQDRLFENEGHGYYDVDNRVTYYRELLDFFDRHMKD